MTPYISWRWNEHTLHKIGIYYNFSLRHSSSSPSKFKSLFRDKLFEIFFYFWVKNTHIIKQERKFSGICTHYFMLLIIYSVSIHGVTEFSLDYSLGALLWDTQLYFDILYTFCTTYQLIGTRITNKFSGKIFSSINDYTLPLKGGVIWISARCPSM